MSDGRTSRTNSAEEERIGVAMTAIDDLDLILKTMANTIVDNTVYFSELDEVVGDGDFGYSLRSGFEVVQADLETFDHTTVGALLKKIGFVISSKVGGSSGPIWGTAFLRASKEAGEKTEFTDAEVIASGDAAVLAQAAPEADVILNGEFKDPKLFKSTFPLATRLRWAHNLSAGVEQVLSPDIIASTVPLTNGRGVDVVYDSVGKTTFDKSLNSLRPRGLLALFGQSSGSVPPFDPGILNAKGSLFLTRPSLAHHVATREELLWRAGDVLKWIDSGKLKVRIDRVYPLADAADAHRDLEGRRTAGKLLLTIS